MQKSRKDSITLSAKKLIRKKSFSRSFLTLLLDAWYDGPKKKHTRDMASRVCDEAKAAIDAFPDGAKVVLFDYNGTLGYRPRSTRPGIQYIEQLRERGFKVGLFTNALAKNIPIENLQGQGGFVFDVVLDQTCCGDKIPGTYDLFKDVRGWFPQENFEYVKLMDDTPHKVPAAQREDVLIEIKTWERTNQQDAALREVISSILESAGHTLTQLPPTQSDHSETRVKSNDVVRCDTVLYCTEHGSPAKPIDAWYDCGGCLNESNIWGEVNGYTYCVSPYITREGTYNGVWVTAHKQRWQVGLVASWG